jgi:C-terminal processing protease CtpA/Prc
MPTNSLRHSTKKLSGGVLLTAVMFFSHGAFLSTMAQQNPPSKFEIERGRTMLDDIKADLKKNYYDPNFHGLDIEARFKEADEKIKSATSLGQIFGAIAVFLMRLDDSHCFFVPPRRSYRTEYGWKMLPIGDKNYVIAVKPGSDAESKGLKPGDQVYAVDGVRQTRQNFWVF